jgi:hypoxanthine phosphoribosyltransferase
MNDWTPLFTQKEIQTRVKELGKEISKDFANKDVLVLGVLKGACIFFSDLIRSVEVPLAIDFFITSSYVKTKSSGNLEIHYEKKETAKDKDVLIIDDIVDTGLTLKLLKERILKENPKSVKLCTLLDKKEKREINVEVDYVGFEIPDQFVVGYGMDYENQFRNLPYISELIQPLKTPN